MSKIEDEMRQPNASEPHIKFIDGYELQIDQNNNHRLVNWLTNDASDWTPEAGISVLHDKFVVRQIWQQRFPFNRLLRWESLQHARV